MKQKITPTQKTLNLWAVILILWSIYRANFHFPDWVDEFVFKPLVFILPVFIYVRRNEKGGFFHNINFYNKKTWKTDLGLGFLIGAAFFLSALIANYLKTKKFVLFLHPPASFLSMVLVFATVIATAVSEEILSRGFVLKRLYQESKNIYSSSFFASILFFFLHVPILFTNAKMVGNLLLAFMFVDISLSIINSLVYLNRKSLILPILIHAFYNLSLILFV
ncbi:CPBP family intramembrane metalloprotease [Candidatus Roizmanbacteria bacterium]|jgi:membrane protease YdiL (CAAX protease family)|nr:CPBP family intramembrane metalloprotease [Candidatus Roizmanbacteria bacterium]